MDRSIYNQLLAWKNREGRKPLILNGARQVGKTYVLQQFGKNEYQKLAFFSLDRNAKAVEVFEKGGSTADMLMALSAISQTDITPNDTLVVLDEIQDCPKALEALKFFCEDAPHIHIIVAGSLLGLSLHSGVSYPVGKVEELRLYPMNFIEFLQAMDKPQLVGLLEKGNWNVIRLLETELIGLLRQYYYVGGMPAVVSAFAEGGDIEHVRNLQNGILESYERDFSKHAPAIEVPRIRMVWQSVPAQLSKENRKFVYGVVKEGARAKDFELAIEWLKDAGLIYKVNRSKKGQLPLAAYEDFSAFKIFMSDIGLMGAMSKLPAQSLLSGNALFSDFKGALTEQYVMQQLKTNSNLAIYYWSADSSRGEIDFLLQRDCDIIPVEVKAEENLQAKSLRSFVEKNPGLHGVRLSMSPYREQDWMTNYPLYSVLVVL